MLEKRETHLHRLSKVSNWEESEREVLVDDGSCASCECNQSVSAASAPQRANIYIPIQPGVCVGRQASAICLCVFSVECRKEAPRHIISQRSAWECTPRSKTQHSLMRFCVFLARTESGRERVGAAECLRKHLGTMKCNKVARGCSLVIQNWTR